MSTSRRRRYVFRVVDSENHVCLSWTGVVDDPREVIAVPDFGPRVRLLQDGHYLPIATGHRHPGRALTLIRERASGGRAVATPIPPAFGGLYSEGEAP